VSFTTPVTDGQFLYTLNDNGVMSCLHARTGEDIYIKQRLSSGSYSASPVLADGKLYITGENGTTVVLSAGPEYNELARNDLDGSWTMSSIAVSGQQLFIRTGSHLYCIGNKAAN